jgi:proton glutamate symport protein
MSLTARVVGGLALGLAAGAMVNAARTPALLAITAAVERVGTLWVNGILMTVIPLVVSSLIIGVASTADPRLIGRLGRRAILLFLILLCASAGITALIAPPLVARVPIDAAVAASLRSSSAAAGLEPVQPVPTPGQWLVGLVPANPVKAPAEGSMVPLIVFTLAFALAIARLPAELRQTLIRFFQGVALAVLLSLATPGIPAAGLLVAAPPMFGAAGVPVGAIGVLVALDTIPDMFRAPANVTADLAVATILARHPRDPVMPTSAVPAPIESGAA